MPQTPTKKIGLAAGLLAFGVLSCVDSSLHHHPELGARPAHAAALIALMAIWWITEALPIYWTALVPLVVCPVLPVFPGGAAENLRDAALPYLNPYIFLFMGGMCIAAAMQQCGLHRRIAIQIMSNIGTDPRRLLLGVLSATAAISMWISNTATATMMFPIGLAIISQLEGRSNHQRLVHYGAALMLAIAYGANIGGVGTKIGTAPNAQFAGYMVSQGVEVSFLQFLVVGGGFMLLFLPIAWFALWRVGRADAPAPEIGAAVLAPELASLGRWRRAEKLVLVVFLITATLWIVAQPLTALCAPSIKWFELKSAHVEGAISLLAAVALLVARVDGRRTLEIASLRRVPWGTLVLLGGSFSMASGVEASSLSKSFADQLVGLRELASFPQTLVASSVSVVLSAFASNTATIGVLLPVLKSVVTPEQLTTVLFAATIASSCDFALPAGTPPNAIVFGSGYVTVPRMAKTGALLDVAAAFVAALWCYAIVRFVF
ncbi:MAG: SLC13 family permease [Planctomycetota bacterium]